VSGVSDNKLFKLFKKIIPAARAPITDSLIEQLFVSQRQQRSLPSGRSSTATGDSRPEHPGGRNRHFSRLNPALMASEQTRGRVTERLANNPDKAARGAAG